MSEIKLRPVRVGRGWSAIYLSAVTYVEYCDNSRCIVDFVDHTIVADTESPAFAAG